MLKSMTVEDNLDRLFYLTPLVIYTPADYAGEDAVFQFELEAGGRTFHYFLDIRNGGMSYSRGEHPNPDATVETTADEWLGIANQTVNPALSIMLGRTRVKGNMGLFKALGKALNVNSIRFRDEAEEWEEPRATKWEKPEKILVINGSPRAKNGYTYFFLKRLIDGMESAGSKVEEIDVYDRDVSFEPCRGCFSCWERKGEGKCVIGDGAAAIVDGIFDSYLTVYAFPVYIDSVPARLKALLDRQFIFLENQFSRIGATTRHPFYRRPRERYTAMFATNGFPEIEHFDPLKEMFRSNARGFKAPLVAEIVRPGATALYEEPTLFSHLQSVQEALVMAGSELALSGGVSKRLLRRISSLPRNYTKDAWYFMANRFNKLERKRPPEAGSGVTPEVPPAARA